MTTIKNPIEASLEAANRQYASQIQDALKLLNSAMNTLKSAQQPIALNPPESSQSTVVNPTQRSESITDQNSPIMSVLKSNMNNAHQAIKAAEEGVKAAMEKAEQHVQNSMQSFTETPENKQEQKPS